MAFESLPNRISHFPTYSPINPPARPPPFPTAALVLSALDKLLPALDPLENAKRRLAMESIPIERLKLAAEKERIPLAIEATKLDLANKKRQQEQLSAAQKTLEKLNNNLNSSHEELFGKSPALPAQEAPNDTPPTDLFPTEDGLSALDIPQ